MYPFVAALVKASSLSLSLSLSLSSSWVPQLQNPSSRFHLAGQAKQATPESQQTDQTRHHNTTGHPHQTSTTTIEQNRHQTTTTKPNQTTQPYPTTPCQTQHYPVPTNPLIYLPTYLSTYPSKNTSHPSYLPTYLLTYLPTPPKRPLHQTIP
jgi:hypothetical protein